MQSKGCRAKLKSWVTWVGITALNVQQVILPQMLHVPKDIWTVSDSVWCVSCLVLLKICHLKPIGLQMTTWARSGRAFLASHTTRV